MKRANLDKAIKLARYIDDLEDEVDELTRMRDEQGEGTTDFTLFIKSDTYGTIQINAQSIWLVLDEEIKHKKQLIQESEESWNKL